MRSLGAKAAPSSRPGRSRRAATSRRVSYLEHTDDDISDAGSDDDVHPLAAIAEESEPHSGRYKATGTKKKSSRHPGKLNRSLSAKNGKKAAVRELTGSAKRTKEASKITRRIGHLEFVSETESEIDTFRNKTRSRKDGEARKTGKNDDEEFDEMVDELEAVESRLKVKERKEVEDHGRQKKTQMYEESETSNNTEERNENSPIKRGNKNQKTESGAEKSFENEASEMSEMEDSEIRQQDVESDNGQDVSMESQPDEPCKTSAGTGDRQESGNVRSVEREPEERWKNGGGQKKSSRVAETAVPKDIGRLSNKKMTRKDFGAPQLTAVAARPENIDMDILLEDINEEDASVDSWDSHHNEQVPLYFCIYFIALFT